MASFTNGVWTFASPSCPDCIRIRTSQGFPPVPESAWGEQCEDCKPKPVPEPSPEWLAFLVEHPTPTMEEVAAFYKENSSTQ